MAASYAGAPASEVIDGVTVHRRGHWSVANFVLPGVVRRLLRQHRYDLLVEDINKIPFYTPLYAGSVPVLAVVPHLFGTTVYRDVDFEVISPSTRDDLVARGLDPGRVTTIYCGLEHQRFTLAEPPPRSATPLLVTWSRLRRYKSIDVAIRAFARVRAELPDARMIVMGRGPDEQRLRALTARLGLADSIEFRGFQPWADLVDVLHRCHVCFNPSPKEGWGLTVVEGNQCGLPVVASDRPGLRDSVRDGETGSLVPYGDDAAMAAAALAMLRDPQLWQARSRAARAWAASFSWERCVAESLDLFARVAARGRRP